MTYTQKIGLVLLLLIVGFASGYFSPMQTETVVQDTQAMTALQSTINQCDDITERAAAHLVAVVEFQRLEIIGRKARVFKLCMQDRGYQENTAWLQYSQAVAASVSKSQHISVNEALENLRRMDMKVPTGAEKRPTFWVKNQPL